MRSTPSSPRQCSRTRCCSAWRSWRTPPPFCLANDQRADFQSISRDSCNGQIDYRLPQEQLAGSWQLISSHPERKAFPHWSSRQRCHQSAASNEGLHLLPATHGSGGRFASGRSIFRLPALFLVPSPLSRRFLRGIINRVLRWPAGYRLPATSYMGTRVVCNKTLSYETSSSHETTI